MSYTNIPDQLMRTYELNEHQKNILKEVNQLPLTDLFYIVVQQSDTNANLTLKELKKYIKRSVKEYVKRSDLQTYWEGKENELIKYYCFFETTKEFFLSQHTNILVNEDFYCGFHFHLFISGVNQDYIKELIFQLIIKLVLTYNINTDSLVPLVSQCADIESIACGCCSFLPSAFQLWL